MDIAKLYPAHDMAYIADKVKPVIFRHALGIQNLLCSYLAGFTMYILHGNYLTSLIKHKHLNAAAVDVTWM